VNHLITGGAGFIGSELIDFLLENTNDSVICIDNFQSGSKSNLSNAINNPRFELIRHDVCDPIRLEVDRIWHLACVASPIRYQNNPIATTKTNILGTMNMLGLAKRCGARFLLTSTSEVYGDPEIFPQPESYLGHVNNIGVRSCYDEGKRLAESLCFDYLRIHNVDIKIARIFNTYGPRLQSDDGRVISNFIDQSIKGKPLTIYGDGTQTRSFCYIDDLINGLYLLMNSNSVGPINLGNPQEISINSLAEIVCELSNKKLEIVYKQLPKDDPHRRCPDISRAIKELHWSPKVSLRDGLSFTMRSVRARDEALKIG
jgi:UDP-glucuronate decarboxylase